MFPKPKRKKDQKTLDKVRKKPCVICGDMSDPAHIQTRGAGGDDVLTNVIALCRRHHTEQGAKGWPYMYRSYKGLSDALYAKGWVIRNYGGRERLEKK